MRIRHISIRNFRGIQQLDWALPNAALACLAGRGDSTKSTILEAIRRLFHPHFNLVFDDADFHTCDVSNAIIIAAVVAELPDSFLADERYGLHLVGWNQATATLANEPGEGLEDALRVRLTITEDLEPEWRVFKTDADEGIPFKPSDRAKVGVHLISGTSTDRHLTWSRGSVLSQLTEEDDIAPSLAAAARAAKEALELRRQDLQHFDAVAAVAEETARGLGVNVASNFKAQLDTDAINVRNAGLALHDGALPLRQLGLGSKRMLTTGLQRQAQQAPHVTLFDEVEVGLEPHRIARLIKHLASDASGQYILTTHSPVVLRELSVQALHIVHASVGVVDVVSAAKPGLADSIQGKIRSGAEAFLAPKVIVCEGATEVGLLRGLDDYWATAGLETFAYRGVALFDVNGADKIFELSNELKTLGYDVAVVADSDAPNHFSVANAEALQEAGVEVVMWDGAVSVEERIFNDLPWTGVMASFHAARRIKGDDAALLNQLQTQYGQDFDRNFAAWVEAPALRMALGLAAKTSDWFKRQSWAQEWVAAIAPNLPDPAIAQTDLVQKLNRLRQWIDNV
jgi:putative ATP-dependent endonuclease of OLD family